MYRAGNPNNKKTNDIVAAHPNIVSAHTPWEAVQFADVVLLTVPASAACDVVQQPGDLGGKIINVYDIGGLAFGVGLGRSIAFKILRR